MEDAFNSANELRKEIAYYKKQLDQLTGQNILLDLSLTTLGHSLKQKNEAFAVLTILQSQFTVTTSLESLFAETVKAISTNLGMNRAVILIPSNELNTFRLSHCYGYPPGYFSDPQSTNLVIPPDLIKKGRFVLVNKKNPPDETGTQLQEIFAIQFFAGVPLIFEDKPIAFLITGRLVERVPFSPVIDKGDIDTLNAITSLIGTVLQNKKSVDLQLQKTEVEKENEIITAQKEELGRTLRELKKAQTSLIQSEKMASLGELTAGIAHEIQNPLNFVNNFSEVSSELIDEMKTELATGNQQLAIEIAGDVQLNLEKILHHGKRADAIVKGMLQHSRLSSGVNEPTDINALADEYLRLAYHGFRAKDKSFNATMKTDYDPSIGLINIIPQDIGRVILNLITNAFYAVTEKKKHQPDYEPTVKVMTRKLNDKVEIRVIDNGGGIPQNVLDKIFQPFFTTKPTGQGTGLGLSLSYDIVKAHGGNITVETKQGEGTTFTIQLNTHH